jgi:lysozyme
MSPDAPPPVLDVEATPTSEPANARSMRRLRDMKDMSRRWRACTAEATIIYSSTIIRRSHPTLCPILIWVRRDEISPQVRYGDRNGLCVSFDGRVPGITGAVDQNTPNGSADHWLG